MITKAAFSSPQIALRKSSSISTYYTSMLDLYKLYYQVESSSFFNRIQTNDYYAIYTHEDNLVGFTGLRKRALTTSHGTVDTLYIGQTVMHKDFRGKSLIPRACMRLFAKHFLTHPFRPIYVWCDALTYKPYLLFANGFRTFYPSRKRDNTPKAQEIIQLLGKHYYKENFNAEKGIVRKTVNIIKDPSTVITAQDRQNPDVDFFATANEGHADGNGLILIAPITLMNFLSLGWKCLKKCLKK